MENDILSFKERNRLTEENKNFIYGFTKKFCNRDLDWSEDELNVALIAYNRALSTYTNTALNFFGYAAMLMKNALIAYYKKSGKADKLVLVNSNKDMISYLKALEPSELEAENYIRGQELLNFAEELSKYGLNHRKLLLNTPNYVDTRSDVLYIALVCSENTEILKYLRLNNKLPLDMLMEVTKTNKSFLSKWKKCILAFILLFSSEDYPHIIAYLNIKVDASSEASGVTEAVLGGGSNA